MKKYILTSLLAVALAGGFLASCSDDEGDGAPSISLSQTAATASAGDEVAVTITTKTPAGFKSLVVTKMWDGNPVAGGEEIFDAEQDEYVYTVVEEDADHVVTINFKVIDDNNKSASKDLVITIELTARQLLLKYNWRLSEEIWLAEGTDEISDVYTDDDYRFNADGTYNKSIGAKVDDFSDLWYNYCYYDLNDNTLKLLMSRTGAFGEEVTDTLRITLINNEKLEADITYYDLNVLDDKYEAVEEFKKKFVAIQKVASFDPYLAGAADDTSGPAGSCADVDFEND